MCARVFGCLASFVITLHFVFWDGVSHRIRFGKTIWLASSGHLPFKVTVSIKEEIPCTLGFWCMCFMFRRGFIGKFKDRTVWWGLWEWRYRAGTVWKEEPQLDSWLDVEADGAGPSLTIGRSGAESTRTYYFIGTAITVRRWRLRCPCTRAETHTCRSEDKL